MRASLSKTEIEILASEDHSVMHGLLTHSYLETRKRIKGKQCRDSQVQVQAKHGNLCDSFYR